MLASEKLVDALNLQVANEMAASLQYVAIASYFERETLPELARFFFRQADEERDHAMKFVGFVNDIGADLEISTIEAPQNRFSSAEEAVRLSLSWEQEVTEQIYALVEIAREEKNYIAVRFLDWFVDEQLEEVTSIGTLLGIVQRAGSDGLLHVEEFLARQGGSIGESPAG